MSWRAASYRSPAHSRDGRGVTKSCWAIAARRRGHIAAAVRLAVIPHSHHQREPIAYAVLLGAVLGTPLPARRAR